MSLRELIARLMGQKQPVGQEEPKQPRLATRHRFLVTFENGKESSMTPVPKDACVFTPKDLSYLILDCAYVHDKDLPEILSAVTTRLVGRDH